MILDRSRPAWSTGDQRAEAVFVVDTAGQDKLRVIKVASTPVARPGDIVDFTIRFDNVGDRTIGNVTIIDNLTPRLEYVPDSAQASLQGQLLDADQRRRLARAPLGDRRSASRRRRRRRPLPLPRAVSLTRRGCETASGGFRLRFRNRF